MSVLDWSAPSSQLSGRARQLMIWEVIAVLAVSLGANALHATVSFIGSVTERQALSEQHAVLNGTQAPGRPWLDLFLQLVSITNGLAPVVLVFYLLVRNGESPSSIGVDVSQLRRARSPRSRSRPRSAAPTTCIRGSAPSSATRSWASSSGRCSCAGGERTP